MLIRPNFLSHAAMSRPAAIVVLVCIALSGVFSFNAPAIADGALGILVAIAVMSLPALGRDAPRWPLMLAAACMIFIIGSAAYATALDLPGRHFARLGKHLSLALGPFAGLTLAIACARLRWRLDALVALFLASMIVGAFVLLTRNMSAMPALSLSGFLTFLETSAEIAKFGDLNRNTAALATGISLLSTLALTIYALASPLLKGVPAAAVKAGLAAVALVLAALLIAIPSRTAYLATAFALIAFLFAFARYMHVAQRRRVSILIGATVLLIGAAAAGALTYLPSAVSRMSKEVAGASGGPSLVERFFAGGATDERVQLVVLGQHLIAERPLLGWGPDLSRLIPDRAGSTSNLANLNQFHNGYLENIVSFGIVGAGLELSLFAAVLITAWRSASAWRRKLSPAFSAICVAFAVFLAIYNLTESILYVKSAGFLCTFLIAIVCAIPIRQDRVRSAPTFAKKAAAAGDP